MAVENGPILASRIFFISAAESTTPCLIAAQYGEIIAGQRAAVVIFAIAITDAHADEERIGLRDIRIISRGVRGINGASSSSCDASRISAIAAGSVGVALG